MQNHIHVSLDIFTLEALLYSFRLLYSSENSTMFLSAIKDRFGKACGDTLALRLTYSAVLESSHESSKMALEHVTHTSHFTLKVNR
jgi:hypothetical protein